MLRAALTYVEAEKLEHRPVLAYGSMLLAGVGVGKTKDEAVRNAAEEEALRWWESGIFLKCAPCALRLGDYYLSKKDKDRALENYELAENLKSVEAMSAIGDIYWERGEKRRAVEKYEKAEKDGSLLALHRLAELYRFGEYLNENGENVRDQPMALTLYKRAAVKRHLPAAVEAARMQIDGEGVEVNYPDAARWLKEPVDEENWDAVSLLAQLIINEKISEKELRQLRDRDEISNKSNDAVKLALEADENDYPSALLSLVGRVLDERKKTKGVDLKKAVALARSAYGRASNRSIDSEGAWPLYAKSFAYRIQKALADGTVTEAHKGERLELELRYGKLGGPFKRFTIQEMDCGGTKVPFGLYIWDAPDAPFDKDEKKDEHPVPTDAQLKWAKQAHGCTVSDDLRNGFRTLFDIAKTRNLSFTNFLACALDAVKEGNESEVKQRLNRCVQETRQ